MSHCKIHRVQHLNVSCTADAPAEWINNNLRSAEVNNADEARIQCERYWKDPSYRLRKSLARSIQNKLRYQGETKQEKTLELTGCSINELKAHLEANFQDGMHWDNYKHDAHGHMDHIRPCASFDLADHEQQLVCFNWRHLTPAWAHDNIKSQTLMSP